MLISARFGHFSIFSFSPHFTIEGFFHISSIGCFWLIVFFSFAACRHSIFAGAAILRHFEILRLVVTWFHTADWDIVTLSRYVFWLYAACWSVFAEFLMLMGFWLLPSYFSAFPSSAFFIFASSSRAFEVSWYFFSSAEASYLLQSREMPLQLMTPLGCCLLHGWSPPHSPRLITSASLLLRWAFLYSSAVQEVRARLSSDFACCWLPPSFILIPASDIYSGFDIYHHWLAAITLLIFVLFRFLHFWLLLWYTDGLVTAMFMMVYRGASSRLRPP